LLIHGQNDNVVPFNQSELLTDALTKIGVEAELLPVAGGGHGNFNSPEVPKRIQAFFEKRHTSTALPKSTGTLTQWTRHPACQ